MLLRFRSPPRFKNALYRYFSPIRETLQYFHAKYYHRSPLSSPQNMIGQSQSGTGKTAAFVLTMLSRVDFSKNKTQVCPGVGAQ